MTGRVVARLAYPMPADGLDRLVKGLERVYGPGLLIDYAHPEARECMVVVLPEAAAVTLDALDAALVVDVIEGALPGEHDRERLRRLGAIAHRIDPKHPAPEDDDEGAA